AGARSDAFLQGGRRSVERRRGARGGAYRARDRRDRDRAPRVGRRRRHDREPVARRCPARGLARAGVGPDHVRSDRLRRGRPSAHRDVDGLRVAARRQRPARRDLAYPHAVAAQPPRREGPRRSRQHRRAPGGGQRGRRRAGAVRRARSRHAAHAGEDLARDAGGSRKGSSRMTVDRVGGLALALLALFTLEESYRLRLPLGSLQSPGPAYVPVLLALLLLALGVLVAALGARTAPLAVIESREWRHAVAILLVCAF